MSGDEFQSRYASVMDGMLRSAVAETSQLFQTMVEELKAEMSKIKKENEDLKSKCRRFEKARDAGGRESEPRTGPRRNVTDRCDTAIQCDLVPLQVGEIYSGTEEAVEGEQQLEIHGDGNQLSGALNHITFEEKHPIDQPSSNREHTALQQDQRDTLEAPDTPDTAGDNELSCERGTRSQASGPEHPPVVTPPPLEKMEQQSISALTLVASPTENLPETTTLTKEKPSVSPAVEDCIAEVVQPDSLPQRRRGRPPKIAKHIKSPLHPVENKVQSPPTDVLVDQETEHSTSARVDKIEVYPPPATVTLPRRGRPLKKPRPSTFKQQAEEIIKSPQNIVPTAHKTVNPPSAHMEETEDCSLLSPFLEGEHLSVKPNLSKYQQLPEQIDEVTQPSLEIPSVIEALKTSSTEPPKSQPRKRSISYPTLEDAMLLIEAMNAQTFEDDDDDATIGNKSSVQTTSPLAKPQHSPSQITSQTSTLVTDQQSAPGAPETSAAPTLHSPTVTQQKVAKLPTTEESTIAQPPVDLQSTAGSPNQQSNTVAQVKTLVIPKHYTIVSPKSTGPTAMLSNGRRIMVVTPKFPRVTPPKIIVMPRSLSSYGPCMISALSRTQLSTVISTVVSAQKNWSPRVYTAETQPTVPTVTLKTMAVTPTQSLSSAPSQATANSSNHSGNSRPQIIVFKRQMSAVTPGKQQSTTAPQTVVLPVQQHSAGSTETVAVPIDQPCLLSPQQPSSTVSTQTSTVNLATTSSLKCDNFTLSRTNADDSKTVAVPLAQPSPLSSQDSSSTVSTETSTVNLTTTLSHKCDDLTLSKTNSEDSKTVAVPLAQPCTLSTQTSTDNLATTLSQKSDNLASTKTNAADSKMTTASTETCSSLKQSTNAQTLMPLSVPPVSPKKMSAVVKLTRLSLPALRKDILKLKQSPIKKHTEASVLQNVPSIVQEIPVAAVEPSQMSPACEQEIAPMSMTSPAETQPSSKESSITVQVQNSVPPKVPTVVQEKTAAAVKSSQPTSTEDDESTSTQASSFLNKGALLRLSSVISKDVCDPHLQMTKAQFLAQLAVTPIAQVQEQAPSNGVTDTTVGKDDKKGVVVDKNTHLKRVCSHRKPQLKPCKTELNPVSQTEAQPTPVTAKKARLNRDGETPTKTYCTNKNSCESILVSPEKSDLTKNGVSLKTANDTHSPVSLTRSRLSKNTGSPKRTTREGYRKRFNEPTPVSAKRPILIRDAVSPKKFRLAKAANTKTLAKAACTKELSKAANAKKMAHAQKLANGKKLSKATNTQKLATVTSAEKFTKAANAKKLAKATNAKTFTKATNVKNLETTNAQKLAKAVNLQQVPRAVKAKTLVKTENEETENEPEFEGQYGQSENESESEDVLRQSENINKLCQTGKAFWTLPRMEARGRRSSIHQANNNTQGQTPTTLKRCSRNSIPHLIIPLKFEPSVPPYQPQTIAPTSTSNQCPANNSSPPNAPVQSVHGRAPPIISPLQPLSVIGRRLLKNQCGECGRILGSSAALESHVSLHTGRQPFSCLLCGKNFPDAKGLSRHGRVHRNGKIHVCAECGRGFVYRFGLTKHLQMVHGRVKPFVCQICNKGFHTKRDLETHARIHTGEKPFDCSLCEKKFKRMVELNVHLRWHNGEKRHWCPYCGKGFLDFNNLKRHKYIHTGEKPCPCPHCPKKFTQSGHLKKHLTNVHKIR